QGYFTFRTCCCAKSLCNASAFNFRLLLIRGSRGTPPTDLAILPTSSGRCQTPFASLLPAAPYSQCHQLASRIWLEIVPSADRGSGCHVDQSRDARHRRGDWAPERVAWRRRGQTRRTLRRLYGRSLRSGTVVRSRRGAVRSPGPPGHLRARAAPLL